VITRWLLDFGWSVQCNIFDKKQLATSRVVSAKGSEISNRPIALKINVKKFDGIAKV